MSGRGVLGFTTRLWCVGWRFPAAPLAGAVQVLAAARSRLRAHGLEGRRVPSLPPPPPAPLPPRVPRPGEGMCGSWPGVPPVQAPAGKSRLVAWRGPAVQPGHGDIGSGGRGDGTGPSCASALQRHGAALRAGVGAGGLCLAVPASREQPPAAQPRCVRGLTPSWPEIPQPLARGSSCSSMGAQRSRTCGAGRAELGSPSRCPAEPRTSQRCWGLPWVPGAEERWDGCSSSQSACISLPASPCPDPTLPCAVLPLLPPGLGSAAGASCASCKPPIPKCVHPPPSLPCQGSCSARFSLSDGI